MIITCAECKTQFQLEEERVPESGIRVRCSVCKHAFFVAHPDAIDDEALDPVDRVVGGVLAGDSGEIPEVTADLDGAGPPAGSDLAADESWEFGDGGRLSDSGGAERDRFEESFEAAREAVDDLLGSPWEEPAEAAGASPATDAFPLADAAALGPASLPTAPEALEATPAPLEDAETSELDDPWEKPSWSDEAPDVAATASEDAADPAFDDGVDAPFGDGADTAIDDGADAAIDDGVDLPIDDGLDPAIDDGADAAPADGADALDIDLDDPDADPWWERAPPDDGDRRLADAAPPAAEAAGFGEADPALAGDAIGALETDGDGGADAFELDDSAGPGAAEEGLADDWAIDALMDPGSDRTADAAPLAGLDAGAAQALPIDFAGPFAPEPARRSVLAWLARAGSGLGWSAVAILAAVTLWGSVAPRTGPAQGSANQALAGLEATGVSGRWVENAMLGPLYVVTGELRNPGPEMRAAGGRLAVRLLDAEGLPLSATASLAPPLGPLVLGEAGPDELRSAAEVGALRLARTRVAAGARIPFEAVVVGLPDAAQRFDLAATGD